eukprot:9254295-Pyramimonas_sp.AAC.1
MCIRDSTEGPSGCFCLRPPHKSRHSPRTLRGPIGSASECGAYNDGAHNCIWLGPSPCYALTLPCA